jgi:hypothetical protein
MVVVLSWCYVRKVQPAVEKCARTSRLKRKALWGAGAFGILLCIAACLGWKVENNVITVDTWIPGVKAPTTYSVWRVTNGRQPVVALGLWTNSWPDVEIFDGDDIALHFGPTHEDQLEWVGRDSGH